MHFRFILRLESDNHLQIVNVLEAFFGRVFVFDSMNPYDVFFHWSDLPLVQRTSLAVVNMEVWSQSLNDGINADMYGIIKCM